MTSITQQNQEITGDARQGTGTIECPPFLVPYAKEHRWVFWRAQAVDGKLRKPPYDPRTGRRAKMNEPATWGTFDEARRACIDRGGNGVGIVITRSDNIVCVDLDNSRNASTGGLSNIAKELVDLLDAPTEISQSGTGIHVWVQASLPDNFMSKPPYEVYPNGNRYIAITNIYHGSTQPTTYLPWRTDEVSDLITPAPSESIDLATPPLLTDEQLVHAILAGPHGERWRRIRSYDFSGFESDDTGELDRSRIDFNVLLMIADYTNDPEQVERIFEQQMPHLVRDDGWRRDPYRTRSVTKALAHSAASRDRTAGEDTNAGTQRWAAERFVDLHGDDLRYNDTIKQWHVWDGQRFRVATRLENQRAVIEMIDGYRHEVERMPYSPEKTREQKRSRQLESNFALQGIMNIARADYRIAISPDQLDTDPWQFNVQNVTIAMSKDGSWELRQHDRADLITKVSPVDYEPSAKSPHWDQFLAQMFADDGELIRYVRALVGYSMIGSTFEKVLPFVVGPPDTGKTTLLEAIARLFGLESTGGYAQKLEADFFLAKRYDNTEYDLAKLQGVRFAFASEADEGRRMAVARLKALTGNDTLRGRHPYGRPFEYRPSHTLWFATNHLPVVQGTDQAIWNRVRIIPMNVVIPPDKQDRFLAEALSTEGSGMLNWALEGFRDALTVGISQLTPSAVRSATRQYEHESDVTNQWFEESIVVTGNEEDRISAASLYSIYNGWCRESNEQPLSQKKLGEWMRHHGFESVYADGGRKFYRAIRFRAHGAVQ